MQTRIRCLYLDIENELLRPKTSPLATANDLSTHFIRRIRTLQYECTTEPYAHKPNHHAQHPWANTPQYSKLRKLGDKAKASYRKSQSLENKGALDFANAQMYIEYNRLKDKYFQDMIAQMGGTKKNFYAVMKSKRKPKTSIPPIMTIDGRTLTGDQRLNALNDIFKNAYQV